MLAFLPLILQSVNAFKTQTKSDDEIKEEKLAEQKRQDKGAIDNSIDFLFGEGTSEDIDEALNRDILTGKTQNELRIERLEDSASEKLGRDVTFAEDTIIDKEGRISGSPPTFKLNEQDLLDIQRARDQNKTSEAEIILVEAETNLFVGKRTRFGV